MLDQIREQELASVRALIGAGQRVLEIGGGSGFQARKLAEWGCDVASVDIAGRPNIARWFPVQDYDGKRLPFPDQSFDIVFSSNVLEHIPHLSLALEEMARVLKSGGKCVHLMPSATWRFWTSLKHYFETPREIYNRSMGVTRSVSTQALAESVGRAVPAAATSPHPPFLRRAWRAFKYVAYAGVHGEYPGPLQELWYFSRLSWRGVFRRNGYDVELVRSNGLFYTGFAATLSIAARQRLSRALGSSCIVYVARPQR